MHLRHPVVLTTIEEDFRKIGILTEGDESSQEEADDKPAFLKKKMEKAASKKEIAPPKKEADDDEVEEAKMVRTKKGSSGQRRKWKMAKRKAGAKAKSRKYRKKSSVKRMLKIHRKRAQRMRKGKPAGRRRLTFGNDSVSNMLEEVQEIVQSLDTERVEHSIKAFANVAIIAEMLARAFAKYAEEIEDAEDETSLGEAAEFFAEMAESASEIAKSLHEGPDDDEEFDLEALGEEFQSQMSDLLNGLEMYSDINEDADLSADDDDSVTEGDDEDDVDEEDDEDMDEEDDEEEVEAKKPPFLKKKGK